MLEICWAAMAVKRAQLTDFSRKGERGRVHVGTLGCVFMVNNINAVYICIYLIFMTSACQVVTPPLVVRYNSKTDQPPT